MLVVPLKMAIFQLNLIAFKNTIINKKSKLMYLPSYDNTKRPLFYIYTPKVFPVKLNNLLKSYSISHFLHVA